jgi:hypothetical protein
MQHREMLASENRVSHVYPDVARGSAAIKIANKDRQEKQ